MPLISATPEWAALRRHAADLRSAHLRDLFAADPGRAERFTATVGDLRLDWSRHLVTDRTLALLAALAERAGVAERVAAMLSGEPVNATEGRPALHTALRAPARPVEAGLPPGSGAADVGPAVAAQLARMADFARSLRSGELLGATGRPIRTLVNLGIGGSHLGPVMAYEALAAFRHPRVGCRFASNADPADLAAALAGLDPAETMFAVVSKSFTTPETLANARSARAWATSALGPDAVERHFAAVSADPAAVSAFGISPDNAFEMWDWVGGRFSLASAAGLTLMAAIGEAGFRRMLDGMRAVDEHLAALPPAANGPTLPLAANGPMLMGLLAVWYRNFWGLPARAILPYSQRLSRFPAYLQQLEMESNGKAVTLGGRAVDYETGPIVWGGPGTGGQHSFHQLLHQGTTAVPADFIVFAAPDPDTDSLPEAGRHHDLLVANCLAQAAALAFGTPITSPHHRAADSPQGPSAGAPTPASAEPASRGHAVTDPSAHRDPAAHREPAAHQDLAAHEELAGNRPSTLITAPELNPSVLGQLVALYEHQTVVQGAVWGINSFDQYGVQHGKRLAASVLRSLRPPGEAPDPRGEPQNPGGGSPDESDQNDHGHGHDPATVAALRRLGAMRPRPARAP